MILMRYLPIVALSAGAVLLLIIFYLSGSTSYPNLGHDGAVDDSGAWISRPTPLAKSTGSLQDIWNSTLGFQKIYVLSMPARTDKRDALSISAYLTGLDIEFVDGVNATNMPDKSYPQGWNYDEPIGSIGCWRGHMNIYQKMVRERIQTAMIMEDDVDWDVMIKSQMTELARGTRFLQNVTMPTLSPYGDDWNIISTGHCGVNNRIDRDRNYWVVNEDPTVITPAQREWSRKPNLSLDTLAGEHTRLVFNPYKFTCLTSYALSIQGAAQILYDQSILPHAKPIDLALSDMCKREDYGMNTCMSAYPMITGRHRPAGDLSRDSDRTTIASGVRKVALTDYLVFPVRVNIESLLKSKATMKAQNQEHALVKEIDFKTLKLPSGQGFSIRMDDFTKVAAV